MDMVVVTVVAMVEAMMVAMVVTKLLKLRSGSQNNKMETMMLIILQREIR